MLRTAFMTALAALLGAAAPAAAQEFSPHRGAGLFGLFDEIRYGLVYPVQPSDDSGVIISGQLYFRAFGPQYQNYWKNTLLRPRIHIGGNLATGSDPIHQAYAGLTWQFPFRDRYFVEASFGGTVHDGPLDSPGDGLDLGCHLLFRESIGIGVTVGENWRFIASADHSSHADLCDNGDAGNSGITHAGLYAGYRF